MIALNLDGLVEARPAERAQMASPPIVPTVAVGEVAIAALLAQRAHQLGRGPLD